VLILIASVIHKGLAQLLLIGKTTLIAPDLQKRCKRRLDAINSATDLSDLNVAGFNFHPLKGKPQRYSVHLNGPWAITFEWSAPNAYRVNLEQYH